MMLLWEYHKHWNYWQEYHRRFKVKQRQYDPNTPDTTKVGDFRFELHEQNSPAVRAAGGETRIIKQFLSCADAKAHAETLVPWNKVPDTRNGWQKGDVRVTCKRVSHMPLRLLDDKRRLWSIYLEGEFVSSHNNGKAAQEMADQIFEADRAGLIDE